MDTERILNDLLTLHANYSEVLRRTVALDKYARVSLENPRIEPESQLVRESLLEHVGSLPMVATYLYPFLEHKSHIDLGKVLTMLAIHDIGETVVGDSHPHQKTEESIEIEHRKALELLSEEYHPLFEEIELQETLDSQFAKAVDVFATFLSDQVLPPDFVAKRLSTYGFSSQLFVEKRQEVFVWDSFLKELFEEIIQRYQKMGL